mmetsp:Transcript_16730/g.31513  ORF Transcript_16730/g.31513 Transcript_16730/m.31513 type:complete len:240 (-) Transcript_16730:413-1132(-)
MDDEQVANRRGRQVAGQHLTAWTLGEHVAGLAQRAGDDRRLRGARHRPRADQAHRMKCTVHGRPHQFVEAGIHQHEAIRANALHRPHLGQQHRAFGDEVATGFQLQFQRMAHQCLGLAPCGLPQVEVVVDIDPGLAVAVGNRQPAAGRDRVQVMSGSGHPPHQLDHGLPDLRQMVIVDTRSDVHVQPDEPQTVGPHDGQGRFQIAMPDAMFAVLAAGVGLLAVAVAEPGVDAQPDRMAR